MEGEDRERESLTYACIHADGPEEKRQRTDPLYVYRVVAADAKLNFDDNAEYRQKQIFAKRDLTQEDPREVSKSPFYLSLWFSFGG